jgi:hypothetical protein
MVFHLDKILLVCYSVCFLSLKDYSKKPVETKFTIVKQTNSQKQNWEFEKVAGSNLYFKNAKPFKTNLYNLQYIGQVSNGSIPPFLILSGRDCDECDANISVYICSPADGPLKVESGENSYSLPGTERDIEDKSMIFKARAFYGLILPNIKGVIWYQTQLMENGTLKKSVFLVNLNHPDKKEISMKDAGQLQETLKLLKQGLCKEIPGVAYNSEP